MLPACTTARRAVVRRIVHGVPDDRRPRRLRTSCSPTARRRAGGCGHALELRAYRADGVVQLDWWFDARSFEAYTVEELAEQFPLALIELTSEATPPCRHRRAGGRLTERR